MKVEIKIIEEWGFNLGDDACLYDEEDKEVSESQNNEVMQDDFENMEQVDVLADKIVQDLVKTDDLQEDDLNGNGKARTETTDPIKGLEIEHLDGCSDSLVDANHTTEVPSASVESVCKIGPTTEKDKEPLMVVELHDAVSQVGGSSVPPAALDKYGDAGSNRRKRRNKNSSNSLGNSGPWSIDWLQNIQQGDIGLISSKNKRLKKVGKDNGASDGRVPKNVVKKKASGVLRHPVLTLKKVARLPSKDREEVMKVLRDSKIMKILKQKIRNRRRQRERVTRSLEVANSNSTNDSSTMVSGKNDWQNWVVLNGSEAAKAADVQCIGKSIGLTFQGSGYNKFSVLNRQKNVESGTSVADERDVEDEGV
jgi:hypothetical protein